MSSLAGIEATLPSNDSIFPSNQVGRVFGFSAKTLNFSEDLLFSLTDITSPALTE